MPIFEKHRARFEHFWSKMVRALSWRGGKDPGPFLSARKLSEITLISDSRKSKKIHVGKNRAAASEGSQNFAAVGKKNANFSQWFGKGVRATLYFQNSRRRAFGRKIQLLHVILFRFLSSCTHLRRFWFQRENES